MALTELRVRAAKETGKAYTLGDYDGLSLFVSAKGGKAWHFRYYWLGKQVRISLGTYPEIDLCDARALREEARGLIARGVNPKIHRKQKRQAAKLAGEYTFMIAVPPFIANTSLVKTSGATASNRRTVSA